MLINHFPVIGALFLFILLLPATRWQHAGHTRLALSLVVALAVLTWLSFISGQRADAFFDASGIMMSPDTHKLIGLHATQAKWTFYLANISGFLAVVGLVRAQTHKWLLPTLLVMMLGLAGLAGWTSMLGGMIMHTEIRDDAIAKKATEFSLPRLGGHRKKAEQSQDKD